MHTHHDWEMEDEQVNDKRRPGRMFVRGHHHRHGPSEGRDQMAWFGPKGGPFGGGPLGRGGPFGGGGPFGDDPFGNEGPRRRQRRGDMRFVLLEALAKQPDHGYELIRSLEQRYGGFYRPSPGSVYPTLQMLEDEGLITSEPVEGKRVYTITEAGRAALDEWLAREGAPGEGRMRGGPRPELHTLRESVGALTASLIEVGRHGSPEQIQAAIALVDTTRRNLYSILASEPAKPEAE